MALPIYSYGNQIYDNSLNESVFERIRIYFNKTLTHINHFKII